MKPARPAGPRDRDVCWHPYTPMGPWCDPAHEPLVLVRGEGPWLFCENGKRYLDGNSSIWTNIHGHRHPRLDAALRAQLESVAHTSFLGFTHPLAVELAERLLGLFPPGVFGRVFYSDDGSTAIEVALKAAARYHQLRGEPRRTRFIAFARAYHGDTLGASSLGDIPLFHERFAAWHFPVDHVASPEELAAKADPDTACAVVMEPLVQGVNGMRLWPPGALAAVRRWCDRSGALLIFDEVMTGFGRTGAMFACEKEGVYPDAIALAKGLTGGYLPLAATLFAPRVFEEFRGGPERTLYYGHSYCANPLGCAVALASLAVFEEERVLKRIAPVIREFGEILSCLARHPRVKEVRQCGMIAGVEIHNGGPTPLGPALCVAARRWGLLTRPILDTVVLMPPLCCDASHLRLAADAVRNALDEGAA